MANGKRLLVNRQRLQKIPAIDGIAGTFFAKMILEFRTEFNQGFALFGVAEVLEVLDEGSG